jgi:hypothetical protein
MGAEVAQMTDPKPSPSAPKACKCRWTSRDDTGRRVVIRCHADGDPALGGKCQACFSGSHFQHVYG